jgi:hypothetical protein
VYLCVLCGSQNKQLISLYIINLLVVIAETVCVSRVIRTESSNIMQVNNVGRYRVKCNAFPPQVVSACGRQQLCLCIAIVSRVISTESSNIMQVNVGRYRVKCNAFPPRVVSACGRQQLCLCIAIIAHVIYAMVIAESP